MTAGWSFSISTGHVYQWSIWSLPYHKSLRKLDWPTVCSLSLTVRRVLSAHPSYITSMFLVHAGILHILLSIRVTFATGHKLMSSSRYALGKWSVSLLPLMVPLCLLPSLISSL